MARKHRKSGIMKSAVERTLISKGSTKRKIVTNPTTGELEVVTVTTPDVYKQGRALSGTTNRGQRNSTDNMAPKGGKVSKPMGGKK